MSARLDSIKNYGDRHGNVSDPRLVNQLLTMGPSEPTTLEQLGAALDVVAHYAGKKRLSDRSLDTLKDMIFGTKEST